MRGFVAGRGHHGANARFQESSGSSFLPSSFWCLEANESLRRSLPFWESMSNTQMTEMSLTPAEKCREARPAVISTGRELGVEDDSSRRQRAAKGWRRVHRGRGEVEERREM